MKRIKKYVEHSRNHRTGNRNYNFELFVENFGDWCVRSDSFVNDLTCQISFCDCSQDLSTVIINNW